MRRQKFMYLSCACLLLCVAPNMAYPSEVAVERNMQQGRVVKGRVQDSKGEPLIGVTVSVKGQPNKVVVTNIDGDFVIILDNMNATLQFSYTGFSKKEVRVNNQSQLKVVMETDAVDLQEVQVIGYGTQKKVTVTGAISSVNTKELLKTPVASLGNAIVGKMPGLQGTQYSGMPGSDDATLMIRGIGTFGSGTSPLVLVDGVERSFQQIDPNEVEDITILKDASATAVYGIRGANGVILVTTKRGQEGKARVNVTATFGVQSPTKLPEFCNSYQYAQYYNECQLNDGVNPDNVRFSPEIMDAFKNHTQPLIYPDMDWMDYCLRDQTFQTQENVNVSGGTNKVKYFVSAGYLSQDGLFKTFGADYDFNFSYKRYNYRSNVDFQLTKGTTLSVNIGGRVQVTNQPVTVASMSELFRHIYRAAPFMGAGIVDGKWIRSNSDYIPGIDNVNSFDALNAYYGRGYKQNVVNSLNTDFKLTQKLDFITKGLSMHLKGAYNSDAYHYKTRGNTIPYFTPLLNDDGEMVFRKSGADTELSYSESRDATRNWYMELGANYKRSFGKHNVTGLLLYNQTKKYYPSTYTDIPTGYVGMVGRASYNYATKYMVDFNLGYNGSENFAKGHRYGLFPAASVGWVVTQEKFMKKQNVINYLKLRASYGVVGNDQIGGSRFLYLPDAYAFGGGYNFGYDTSSFKPGAYEGKVGNPEVTWEKSYKQNYGVDMYVLNSRLKLNFDYFFDHRTDILMTRNNVPAYPAIDLPAINYGIVDNHGYEVALTWRDKIGNDFKYNVGFNISYARNKIVDMDEIKRDYDYLYRTGKPVNQPFLYKFWGYYYEGANEKYKEEFGVDIPKQSCELKPGDCVYVDQNKDGIIDQNDQVAIGYSWNPEYTGGFSLGFEWNNFEVSMLFNYAFNVTRTLGETFRRPFGESATYGVLLDHYKGRWTADNPGAARYPRASFASAVNNFGMESDLWYTNGAYLRLKNVEMAYNVRSAFLRKNGIKGLRLFANFYNLFTITKVRLTDPELNSTNTPGYPLMRIANFGINLSL